jgi:hypothetical protein
MLSINPMQYSGRGLMGSRIMGSIGLWDHFYPDQKVQNFSSIPNFTLILIPLMVSIAYWNQLASAQKQLPLHNINHDHNKMYPLYQNSVFTVSDQFGAFKDSDHICQ